MFSRLYSQDPGFSGTTSLLDTWVLGSSDPLRNKASALVHFCYPDPSMSTSGSNATHGYETLQAVLSPENVKHFLEQYKNYHSHWPMIHLASFNPTNAYDGLVLTMICIGAVYSERLGVKKVRWLMEIVRAAVFRSSGVYKLASQIPHGVVDSNARSSTEIEETQALIHLHSLFVWHGSQKQRRRALEESWVLARVTRHLGMLRPLPNGHPSFSALHQPGPVDGNEVNTWTWTSWVEQEKRARVMYLIFLIDASVAIFFNVEPQLDVYDIKLPLPADDAAWEALNEEDCACALGLRGEAAQGKNFTGSLRAKQLGMSEALQYLHQGGEFPERATNMFSKFILIHAIHVQIFRIQRQILGICGHSGHSGFSSGTSTPQSQTEWTSTDGSISNPTSGRATPTDSINSRYSHTHQTLRLTMAALELWKRQWDADVQIQYRQRQRRVGFCRDAIHFYFLATLFLRSSRREDWAFRPDARCQQVFNMLKQIRAHVASDSVSKGLDIGSITVVNDNYGIADLTLDMKLLFTPVDETP